MTFACEHLVQQICLRVTLLMVEVQDCLPLLLGTTADTSEKGNTELCSHWLCQKSNQRKNVLIFQKQISFISGIES